jgi:hypothetical protein
MFYSLSQMRLEAGSQFTHSRMAYPNSGQPNMANSMVAHQGRLLLHSLLPDTHADVGACNAATIPSVTHIEYSPGPDSSTVFPY